ncbi:tRNA dimethylallyltransferase [Geomicrobium halophilum]|uniref:tRNA dimethylallyltransferase n=1 Tax=Geomicrobium halophilum TaxID=549000 RepID=A0A841Q0V7_9BACL|nr:tRNA (adenosine(37)-N6)-dimethylallyltransferase MiaA [Geomicrobium halophilum]MBB6449228.1 tRNA dimethylallyltransferase [Geomicrobium halophilum]
MKPVIVIVGPTAVGKSALSIEVAKRFSGEIINGDAFQVYRGLDIGTAKITAEEQESIPHHLLDILDPTETYSAAQFQKDAFQKINEIHDRGHLPIVVGGTGMYIKGITANWTFNKVPAEPELRKQLEERSAQEGGENSLYEELRRLDPEAAKRIHSRNIRKVIRALELLYAGQETPEPVVQTNQQPRPYEMVLVGLTMERTRLYARIEERVEQMLGEGLLSEVRTLYDNGIRYTQAMKGIGYKELVTYFDGESTFEEAITQLKTNSRRFAKRQLTWFRNKENVSWFNMELGKEKEIFEGICRELAGKLSSMSKE